MAVRDARYPCSSCVSYAQASYKGSFCAPASSCCSWCFPTPSYLTLSHAYIMADHDAKMAIDRISGDAAYPLAGPNSEAARGKMRKKIDYRLLPMIILMYIMNYLDRNNIAAVRLAGLQSDLDLSSVQYQVRSLSPTFDRSRARC
jgi:hypothetical protein